LPGRRGIKAVCCSFVLIETNRIDGRVTASQIAAASFASFEIGLHVARRYQPDCVAKRL
jgi:hypothetical protein